MGCPSCALWLVFRNVALLSSSSERRVGFSPKAYSATLIRKARGWFPGTVAPCPTPAPGSPEPPADGSCLLHRPPPTPSLAFGARGEAHREAPAQTGRLSPEHRLHQRQLPGGFNIEMVRSAGNTADPAWGGFTRVGSVL